MKFLSRLSCLLVLFATRCAAACTFSIDLPPPWITEADVAWSACGVEGQGVQAALDHLAALGGGELRFTGAGALVVAEPLRIGSGTRLVGSTAGGPWGTVIAGRLNRRAGYRLSPLVVFVGASQAGMQRFELIAVGPDADHNLHGPVVVVSDSRDVTLSRLRAAAVQMGIAVQTSERTTLRELDLVMRRSRQGRPEGGAGIWLRGASHSLIEHSVIRGDEYYEAGPPSNTDHRKALPGAAPAMDLLATHGGRHNLLRHNRITHGNTAGIYAACLDSAFLCAPEGYEEDLQLWNNEVRHFRQHGVDIAHAVAPRIEGNTIGDTDLGVLALGNVHGGIISGNLLGRGGREPGGPTYGAIHLLWGASGNRIEGNHIHGEGNDFAIYLKPGGGRPYGSPTGNVVGRNRVWSGRHIPGYAGGALAGNSAEGNSLE